MYVVKCKSCGLEFSINHIPGKVVLCRKCLRAKRKDEDTATFLAKKRAEHHTRRWVRNVMSPKSRDAGGSWAGK